MGSKKHKKHHKSDRRERIAEATTSVDRIEPPLRLVLKVGGSSASEHGDSPHVQPHSEIYMDDRTTFRLPDKHKKAKKKKKKKSTDKDKERKHKHHHHHHEKKEKRKRDREDVTADSGNGMTREPICEQPPMKQQAVVMFAEDDSTQAERPFREPRACTLKNRQGKTALQHLLDYLLKTLERKDPQQFFAWPVTDHIAPGYSSIIAHPMDFSTIRTKIENGEFADIAQFKDDVKLMCDNAMTYNRPDTIYYKAAKKLLHVAGKITSKEKLIYLRNSLTYMSELGKEELGFETEDPIPPTIMETDGSGAVISEENVPNMETNKPIVPLGQFEEDSDDDEDEPPEEILAQARKAAKEAADRLTLRRPNSKFGFLRQRNDGSTSLAILNPGSYKEERKVTLEMLVGKLVNGSSSIAGFKEDKRNIVKPVNYLSYGSYGSYAPSYDSTFANLTKEESDLLYSSYGDETGFQYAESILNFSKDCEFVSELADSLLNALTDGDHSKAMKTLDRKKRPEPEPIKRIEDQKVPIKGSPITRVTPTTPSSALEFDFDSLRSLAEEGIDISFLDDVEKEIKKDPIQKKLDETTSLLQNLVKVQNARLSAKPPVHLTNIQGPSIEEMQLASKVTDSLTELSKKATPSDIINPTAIHKAMGISMEHRFPEETDGHESREVESGEGDERVSDGPPHDSSPSCEIIQGNEDTGDKTQSTEGGLDEGFRQTSTLTNAEDIVASHLSGDDPATDLEMELREFLETGPTLRVSDSPSQMDVSLDDVIP